MKHHLPTNIVLGAMLLILFSGTAYAAPGVAHQFYGTVTTNGEPAADGIIITAKMAVPYATCEEPVDNLCAIQSTVTEDGSYGLSPNIFYLNDPNNNRDGKPVYFFVGDVEVAESPFNYFTNGGSTKLDLSATGDFPGGTTGDNPTTDPGGNSPGGGSPLLLKGGDSADNTPGSGDDNDNNDTDEGDADTGENDENTAETNTGTLTVDMNTCSPDWTCSEWSDCVNGLQKRVCVDSNKCDTAEGKPDLEKSCEIEELDDDSFFNQITGAVVGGGAGTWIALLIVIVIVVGGLVYGNRRKIGKKP